ncbi:MAG TPA: hypothetical protein PLL33_10595 [Paracoccus sp. (in: a-proteobacteria)]|nr:hypothetical protein [Paracoccus sp. (in: a-proteobacteria)]
MMWNRAESEPGRLFQAIPCADQFRPMLASSIFHTPSSSEVRLKLVLDSVAARYGKKSREWIKIKDISMKYQSCQKLRNLIAHGRLLHGSPDFSPELRPEFDDIDGIDFDDRDKARFGFFNNALNYEGLFRASLLFPDLARELSAVEQWFRDSRWEAHPVPRTTTGP